MAKDEDRVRDSEEAIGIPDPDVDAPDARNLPAERDAVEPTADPAAAAPATKQRGDTRDAYEQVKHTRSASLWSGLVGGAVILLVLLAFIVQNQQNTQITLLFWEANLPLGVSLLIAAILGALLVGSAGGLRILQLRRAAKKLRD
ncbi:LapA family protein [Tsukamurella sp. DT100]|uniref:LapA family protein n=1 Tax=Tsukamurella sp. DT100 TaxID=3393415 RepID=UPI003CE6AA6F